MKTTYYIIEKDERLVMSLNPSDMKVYKSDIRNNYSTGYISRTSFAAAKKIAKSCGMDVVVWVGSEKSNDERVYIS